MTAEPTPQPDRLRQLLAAADVLPIRLRLSIPTEFPITLPLLRGLWGHALHDYSPAAYHAVFHPPDSQPHYLIRSPDTLPDSPEDVPVDLVLTGKGCGHVLEALKALGTLEERGLGRNRLPFRVRSMHVINLRTGEPDAAMPPLPQPLSMATTGLDGAGDWPCRLEFTTPVALISGGELVREPSLELLTQVVFRRLTKVIAGRAPFRPGYLLPALSATASRVEGGDAWSGDGVSYFHRQRHKPRPQRRDCVIGSLTFPSGLGWIHPLLIAGQWLGIGKNFTCGLGSYTVRFLPGRGGVTAPPFPATGASASSTA